MSQQCFRMKGTTLTSIVLEVLQFDPDEFENQLAEKIASAPQFFTRSSLIIHLCKPLSITEFELLLALCRRHHLQPMAVKGEAEGLRDTINELGLADISQSRLSEKALKTGEETVTTAEQKPESTGPDEAAAAQFKEVRSAKVISRPVRSGQQVYAEGTDLIIIGAVSEGAEILADGNIHVYGPLRGRALAGVKGNTQARIFCQLMEAELVSIAGRFVMQDQIQNKCWKQAAHTYLEEDAIRVEAML